MSDTDDLFDDGAEAAPTRGRPRVARPKEAPGQRTTTVRTTSVRRRRAGGKSEDYFYIPDNLRSQIVRQGLACEFKRMRYFGMDEDPDYHIALAENGWEPLSLKSFPDFKRLLPPSWNKDTFEKRGQILMVRPKELSEEAKDEDQYMANSQVKGHLKSLTNSGKDEAPRVTPQGDKLVAVKRTYERGVPIE